MPDPEVAKALIWHIVGDILAISEDTRENAALTRTDLSKCIGSPLYSICVTGFATHSTKTSCLATLYFDNTNAAL